MDYILNYIEIILGVIAIISAIAGIRYFRKKPNPQKTTIIGNNNTVKNTIIGKDDKE